MVRRMRLVIAASAALFALTACSSEPQASPSPDPSVGGGEALGSCVEQYSPSTLAKRSWAFDGTVKSSMKATTETGADSVTFAVNHWFKGGTSSSITVETYGLGGVTSAGSISGQVGERMLVTGEEDSLWTCGFTQPYTETVAADWSAAFGA